MPAPRRGARWPIFIPRQGARDDYAYGSVAGWMDRGPRRPIYVAHHGTSPPTRPHLSLLGAGDTRSLVGRHVLFPRVPRWSAGVARAGGGTGAPIQPAGW